MVLLALVSPQLAVDVSQLSVTLSVCAARGSREILVEFAGVCSSLGFCRAPAAPWGGGSHISQPPAERGRAQGCLWGHLALQGLPGHGSQLEFTAHSLGQPRVSRQDQLLVQAALPLLRVAQTFPGGFPIPSPCATANPRR